MRTGYAHRGYSLLFLIPAALCAGVAETAPRLDVFIGSYSDSNHNGRIILPETQVGDYQMSGGEVCISGFCGGVGGRATQPPGHYTHRFQHPVQ